MGITSFSFLCFFALMLILYYLIPKRLQWGFLLLCSAAYCLLAGQGFLLLYPLFSVLSCFCGARLIYRAQTAAQRRRKGILLLTITVNIGVLFALKYVNFLINAANGVSSLLGASGRLYSVEFLAPLGVSFYTFTLLGYVIDVYYGLTAPQGNFFRLLLYGLYFPNLISGPILKYRESAAQFFAPHPFDYRQVTRGLQRMVWGFFKKLVIAGRLGLLVDMVYGGYEQYAGAYVWVATACYALQLYADFSGCMDIVLGLSESLGIALPENFQTPFFAKSVAEYWRRWHITLGEWMKDYVFYPLLRSGFFTNLNKKLRAKWGKRKGKRCATFAAMFLLWLTVGVWHGGDFKFVIGSGLLHWCYIVLEELFADPFSRLLSRLSVNPSGRAVNLFRMLRTFVLVCVGDLFFRAASLGDALRMLRAAVTVWNPQILWDGSLLSLGLDGVEAAVTALSLLLLWAVSLAGCKASLRDRIVKCPLPLRWALWQALLFTVILFGHYGPGYNAAAFIYQGF